MGLDMYLRAKLYLSNYDFRPDEKVLNTAIRETLGFSHWNDETVSAEVSLTVGYWRKSNQIHRWFVENMQHGKDECQEVWVDRVGLEKLRDTCDKVLTDRDPSLLPPQSGFFFGSTDVDEWYWEDVERTRELLDRILADERLKNCEFYYQSSW
jgi:hypothetical protein